MTASPAAARPVLVTGAGGFIGRAVCAQLRAAGLPVRAGYRTAPPDAEGVACDLDAPDRLGDAVAGAGAIVHAAYRATARMPAQIEALLAAADAAGTTRLVFLSSIAVYGDRAGVLDEDAAPGRLDAYGAAKRACEERLLAWTRAGSPSRPRRAVILRPGIVYGRGSALWIDRPLAALRAGALGDLGPRGEGHAALVHVDDVAEAVRLALAAAVADDAGFSALALNLTGPERPTWNLFFRRLAEAAGLPAPRPIGPASFAARRALALPAKALARLGLPSPPRLAGFPSAGERGLFARKAEYPAGRAAARLGWRPDTPLAQGLARSFGGEPVRPDR